MALLRLAEPVLLRSFETEQCKWLCFLRGLRRLRRKVAIWRWWLRCPAAVPNETLSARDFAWFIQGQSLCANCSPQNRTYWTYLSYLILKSTEFRMISNQTA